jgi:hypothetical protein
MEAAIIATSLAFPKYPLKARPQWIIALARYIRSETAGRAAPGRNHWRIADG